MDAASVVGSRPDGWWRDRAGAARTLVAAIVDAVGVGTLEPEVVVVLEGQARAGAPVGTAGPGVTVVHAARAGDDEIVARVAGAGGLPAGVRVVSADRGLGARVRAHGAEVVGPTWLRTRIDRGSPS
ncbi:MAG: hypothetical protein ACKOA9_10440 [Actinomycetota bacterium]